MADNVKPIDWCAFFVNTVGFLMGFIFGSLTGFFGNWLWYRFGPKNTKPHMKIDSDNTGVQFSGLMTGDNQSQVLKTLKATATPQGVLGQQGSSPGSTSAKSSAPAST